MSRSTHVRNYSNLSGGVITDLNPLVGAPENAVKDALNFEFSATDGAARRKALDLESGIAGADYTQLDSDLAIGVHKHQVFTFKNVLDQLDTPMHDIVFSTFEGKGIVYELGNDQQLADAVIDISVATTTVLEAGVWKDIAWSPKLGIFAAVGMDNDTPIMISSDGQFWSEPSSSTSFPAINQPSTITWSEDLGIFVAISSGNAMISSDGTTWQVYATTVNISSPRDIIWVSSLGLFVAISGTASTRAMSSPDGIAWTLQPSISTAKFWESITWSESLGLLVVVANGGTAGQLVTTSPDGITWTLRNTPATDRVWTYATWSPSLSKFVAIGYTDYIMTSTDGLTWAEAQNAAENNSWEKLIWCEDLTLFVAVSSDGTNRVMTSPDGTTWTARSAQSGDWLNIVWSSELGRLVAVADAGTEQAMISSDGITWDASFPTSDLTENPGDWINLKGVAIGTNGYPELSVLYNGGATYELTTTFGLGNGALIRDFTGIYDGLAQDENPALMVFTNGSVVGTFVEGEDITITDGSAITRRFRIVDLQSASVWGVDKSLSTTNTAFDAAENSDNYATFTVLGETSAATATITSYAGVGLSDAHRYNLINQGWTQTHMDAYAKSKDMWPSNAQVWYSGRDSSNNFDPDELDKVAFGNSDAPKGHILLSPFREWRANKVAGVWSGAVPHATYSRGFTTLASFGSRIAMSGASINGVQNGVYISSILIDKLVTKDSPNVLDLDFSNVFKFYQMNDPTADIANELLADDGVFVPITGANRIYKVVELGKSLLVAADNGWWAISGKDLQSGFLSDDFSVDKIDGAPGTTNTRAVVSTSKAVYYWADEGIYAIQVNQEGKQLIAENITINRIGKLYKGITPTVRESAISYHDESNHKLYWAYNGETTATYPEFRNKLLVLDLEIDAFYPLKTPEKLTCDQGHLSTLYMSINGFTQDKTYPESDGTVPLKLFVTQTDGTDWYHAVMEFNNSNDDLKFDDFAQWRSDVHSDTDPGVDEDAFIETYPDSLGDTSRDKQPVWVFTHMTKTETGWSDNGDGSLDPVGESSLLMRNQWDWHDTDASGKFGNQREIYRHLRPYVPEDDTDTYDTGETIVTTKNKVYGEGMALSLRFDAQQNKDAILLGFAIPYSIANSP